MFKFAVALFLITFDPKLSPDGKAEFDMLPDFIGYVIMIYGFYKIWKRNKEEIEALGSVIKKAEIATIAAFVISYIQYLLDMYGIFQGLNKYLILIIGFATDITLVLVIYMYIQVLAALQQDKMYFQVKGLSTLWKVLLICVAGEYLTIMYVSSVAYTFFVFVILISIVFIIYMFTSALTYKMKFLSDRL